jgi:hypothetical protein
LARLDLLGNLLHGGSFGKSPRNVSGAGETATSNFSRRRGYTGYAELTAQSRPHDGLQLDHQPSHASNVRRMEIALDRQLTRLEEDALRDASTAVAVPTAWHQQNSPTYGGRNSRWRIEMDARFPLLAATRDALAMVRRASPSDRGAALQAFHQIRDRAIELGRSFRLRRR